MAPASLQPEPDCVTLLLGRLTSTTYHALHEGATPEQVGNTVTAAIARYAEAARNDAERARSRLRVVPAAD